MLTPREVTAFGAGVICSAQTTSTVQDALAVRVKVKSLVWCDGCRAVGAIHCSDPENCGYMVSAEAAADSWKAWLDDLPLPEDFAVGIGRLEDFIDRIVANAIVEPPPQPITVQDAARVPEIAALIEATQALADHDAFLDREYLSSDLNDKLDAVRAALRAIAGGDNG